MSAAPRFSPLALLLSRLEAVRQHGKGWRANCPNAHKSKGTLSITAANDGRILLCCFAGCSAAEVMHSIGLKLSDLFDKPLTAGLNPTERRELRQSAKQSQWSAALDVVGREAKIIQIAGQQIQDGIPLDGEDAVRLGEAVQRIESARLVLNAR